MGQIKYCKLHIVTAIKIAMAFRYIVRSSTLQTGGKILQLQFLPNRMISANMSDEATEEKKVSRLIVSHAFSTKLYNAENSPKWDEFLADYRPLWNIRKLSDAVVRRPHYQEKEDEESSVASRKELLVVGNPTQIEKAFRLLDRALDLKTDPGDFNITSNVRKDSPYHQHFNHENKLIWEGYRRNFRGQYVPKQSRERCIYPKWGRDEYALKGQVGNPCPLCQMIYMSDFHIQFTDIELLRHFICPHTLDVLETVVTGLCRMQQHNVTHAVEKARLHGYLPMRLLMPHEIPDTPKFDPKGLPKDRRVKKKRAQSWIPQPWFPHLNKGRKRLSKIKL